MFPNQECGWAWDFRPVRVNKLFNFHIFYIPGKVQQGVPKRDGGV